MHVVAATAAQSSGLSELAVASTACTRLPQSLASGSQNYCSTSGCHRSSSSDCPENADVAWSSSASA